MYSGADNLKVGKPFNYDITDLTSWTKLICLHDKYNQTSMLVVLQQYI